MGWNVLRRRNLILLKLWFHGPYHRKSCLKNIVAKGTTTFVRSNAFRADSSYCIYVNQYFVHWSMQKATHLMQWTRYWSTFTWYNESALIKNLLQKGFYHIVCQLENRNEAIILQCSFIGFVQVSYSLKRKILSITTLLLVPYTFSFSINSGGLISKKTQLNLNYKNWDHSLLLDRLDLVMILINGNSDNKNSINRYYYPFHWIGRWLKTKY